MKCSRCGKKNAAGANFCEHCGAGLKPLVCPKCGKENMVASKFCKYCGEALEGAIASAATTLVEEQPPDAPGPAGGKWGRGWGWLWVLVGLLVAGGLWVGAVLLWPELSGGHTTEVTTATRQPQATATPIREMPVLLEQRLEHPVVVDLERFNLRPTTWGFSDNASLVNDGGKRLSLQGTSPYSTYAVAPSFTTGHGALVSFMLSDTNAEFFIFKNEWNTPSYRRFGGGMYAQQHMESSIVEGMDSQWSYQDMAGSLRFVSGHWYGLFIGIDRQGSTLFLAWDWNNPEQYIWYEFQGNDTWKGGEWNFDVQVDSGTVLLDDYSKIAFGGYARVEQQSAAGLSCGVSLTVSKNTNCRTGPSTQYPVVGGLYEGEIAEVVGKSMDGGTWVIVDPHGTGTCWLWGGYATVSGDTDCLPIVDMPSLPATNEPAAADTPQDDTTYVTAGMTCQANPNPVIQGNLVTFSASGLDPTTEHKFQLYDYESPTAFWMIETHSFYPDANGNFMFTRTFNSTGIISFWVNNQLTQDVCPIVYVEIIEP